MTAPDEEEICIVASFASAEEAERVRSGLPAAWNADVEGTDVIVVAKDDAHATEVENALRPLAAEPAPGGGDLGGEVVGGIMQAAGNLLDYL